MPNYKEMYYTLVRAQRDAILILQEAHQKTEEMLLSADVPAHLRVVHPESPPEGEQADIRSLKLSTRVHNALERWFGKRGHDYVPTINDVLRIDSYRELKKIRSLGKKSHLELILKMREAGFTDWAEQMANQIDRRFKHKN